MIRRRQPGGREALAIIDSVVADIGTLMGGVAGGVRVVVLPAGGDGLAHLAAALEGERGLSTLHLVSHDEPSPLRLSATMLPLV